MEIIILAPAKTIVIISLEAEPIGERKLRKQSRVERLYPIKIPVYRSGQQWISYSRIPGGISINTPVLIVHAPKWAHHICICLIDGDIIIRPIRKLRIGPNF